MDPWWKMFCSENLVEYSRYREILRHYTCLISIEEHLRKLGKSKMNSLECLLYGIACIRNMRLELENFKYFQKIKFYSFQKYHLDYLGFLIISI
jgi:hypothetical protein